MRPLYEIVEEGARTPEYVSSVGRNDERTGPDTYCVQ